MTKKPRAKFYGNKSTKRFHNGSRNNDRCRAGEIKSSNRIPFDSQEEAEESGYLACKLCIKSA